MPRKKRTTASGSPLPLIASRLAEDLREADELATAINFKASPEDRLQIALWLAVERLHHSIRTAAPAPWEFSKEATYDKARTIGVAPGPGECWQALAQRLKQVSGWPAE